MYKTKCYIFDTIFFHLIFISNVKTDLSTYSNNLIRTKYFLQMLQDY